MKTCSQNLRKWKFTRRVLWDEERFRLSVVVRLMTATAAAVAAKLPRRKDDLMGFFAGDSFYTHLSILHDIIITGGF